MVAGYTMLLSIVAQIAESASTNMGALIVVNLGALGINAGTMLVGILRAGRILEKVESHDKAIDKLETVQIAQGNDIAALKAVRTGN